jgi:hypothetical protein
MLAAAACHPHVKNFCPWREKGTGFPNLFLGRVQNQVQTGFVTSEEKENTKKTS